MARRSLSFLLGFLLGAIITAVIYLNGWNKGFDVGYGAAMADVFLGLKSPEQAIKDLEDQ